MSEPRRFLIGAGNKPVLAKYWAIDCVPSFKPEATEIVAVEATAYDSLLAEREQLERDNERLRGYDEHPGGWHTLVEQEQQRAERAERQMRDALEHVERARAAAGEPNATIPSARANSVRQNLRFAKELLA